MNIKNLKNQEGNVLFLILIAVALFAALSFAVTQSMQGGGDNANDESNLVNSSVVASYPASVKTSMLRLQVSGGVDAEDLLFDSSSATASVFHPSAGGATDVLTSAQYMDTGDGQWVYSSYYQVEGIGTNDTNATSSNDIIAFLPGIKESLCERINAEFGITTGGTDADTDGVAVGATTLPDYDTHNMDAGDPGIGTAVDTSSAAFYISGARFAGQTRGCYDQDDSSAGGPFVYYHVLVAR